MDPYYEERLRDDVPSLHSLCHQCPTRTNPNPKNANPNYNISKHLQPSKSTQFKKERKTPRGRKGKQWPPVSVVESPCNPFDETPPATSSGCSNLKPHLTHTNQLPSAEEQARFVAKEVQQKALKAAQEFFASNAYCDGDDNDEDGEYEDDDFFLKVFMENSELRGYYEKDWESGEFCCLVCGGFGKMFNGCNALVQHSIAIAKTKKKGAHRAYGQAICKVLGWDIDRLPNRRLAKSGGSQVAAKESTSGDPKSTESTMHCQHGKPPSPPKPKVKSSKRKSMVWDHFTRVENSDSENRRASCNYCSTTYACESKNNGTMNLLNHLEVQCKKYPYRIEDRSRTALSFGPKKEEGEGGAALVTISFSVEACREALAKMIIIDGLPFSFVEGEGFRQFMRVAQPKLIIPSSITVARDCLKLYLDEKTKLKSVIRGQKICITTDTWTSIQDIKYMCLTAHFIDNQWKLHKKILNFCQVQSHKGEILGKVVETCLLDWGIDSIYTVTVDNASCNNGTIQYLKRRTKKWKGTILEHDYLHMRCCAHILNLIVGDCLKELDESIVKVRNVVRYVKSSPSRLANFKKCVEKERIECKGLLCLDVPTRWNSTYMMLETAEKFEKAFERMEEDDSHYAYYFREEEEDESDGSEIEREEGIEIRVIMKPPKSVDWEKVRIFVKFLKNFYNATLQFSGSLYVTSNDFFHEFVLIKKKLIHFRKNGDYFSSSMADNMLKKFDQYWNLEKVNFLLFVAVVLDPRYKLKYVSFWLSHLYESNVAKDMSRKVKDALVRLYDWYDDRNSSSSVLSHNVNQLSEVVGLDDDDDDDDSVKGLAYLASRFKRHLEAENSLKAMSEVERYLGETCEEANTNFDILGWWKNNSSNYRILSLVARDVLAIPVSTVASESAFSTRGHVLDPFRSSMPPKTVEALVCAQNWFRSSSTPISLRDAMDEVTQFEKIDAELLGSTSLMELNLVE